MATTSTDAHLKKNIEDQLDRLIRQLKDLDEYRAEMDVDEYSEMKKETMDQLQEFQVTLAKFSQGDLSLVDELGAMRMAIQAAISEAFRTPEIIALFAKKQPAALRLKLEELSRDHKMKRVADQIFTDRKLEILVALKKLNAQLSDDERLFISEHSNTNLQNFELATGELTENEKVLAMLGGKQ